ncbi:MAG: acylneuraminate cytidylyltransferase family protein [Pseudomonadota bacterium]
MMVLGLIPARAGSSELKLKNIRPVNGRPLIEYTIEAALASKIDRVIVSTDSEEIAEIARAAGAEVPFLRPGKYASNSATAMSVVQHCLEWLKREKGRLPEAVCYLQPTSPLRTTDLIDKAIDLLDDETDSVLSLVPVRQHPYYMFEMGPEGRMKEFLKIGNKPERRQDLPTLFSISGTIFLSKTSYLLGCSGEVINYDNFKPLIVGVREAVDIDTVFDLQIAECLMSMKGQGELAG